MIKRQPSEEPLPLTASPVVPDGYEVLQLDGRWRLFGEGCTESDPPELLEQDGDGVVYSDGYADGPVDARAVAALCWAILHDRAPAHARVPSE